MAFDYRVDHYAKDGSVTHRTPYRMVIDQEHGQRMERPPGSGIWYKPDGSIFKDESAEVRAKQELEARQAKALEEKRQAEERERIRAEIRAELLAEEQLKKAGTHGPGSKK